MKDALKLVESNRIYKKIFKEVYKKYKSYGKITGSFTLKPKNEEERRVLSNFDPSVLYKDSAKINSEGEKLAQENAGAGGPKWLYSDFKKKGGFLRSLKISEEYGLYRQQYCGCVYSYNTRQQK